MSACLTQGIESKLEEQSHASALFDREAVFKLGQHIVLQLAQIMTPMSHQGSGLMTPTSMRSQTPDVRAQGAFPQHPANRIGPRLASTTLTSKEHNSRLLEDSVGVFKGGSLWALPRSSSPEEDESSTENISYPPTTFTDTSTHPLCHERDNTVATDVGGKTLPTQHTHIRSNNRRIRQTRRLRTNYTEEENRLLLKMKATLDKPWSEVLSHFPTRSRQSVQAHFARLSLSTPHQPTIKTRATKASEPSSRLDLSPTNNKSEAKVRRSQMYSQQCGAIGKVIESSKTSTPLTSTRASARIKAKFDVSSHSTSGPKFGLNLHDTSQGGDVETLSTVRALSPKPDACPMSTTKRSEPSAPQNESQKDPRQTFCSNTMAKEMNIQNETEHTQIVTSISCNKLQDAQTPTSCTLRNRKCTSSGNSAPKLALTLSKTNVVKAVATIAPAVPVVVIPSAISSRLLQAKAKQILAISSTNENTSISKAQSASTLDWDLSTSGTNTESDELDSSIIVVTPRTLALPLSTDSKSKARRESRPSTSGSTLLKRTPIGPQDKVLNRILALPQALPMTAATNNSRPSGVRTRPIDDLGSDDELA